MILGRFARSSAAWSGRSKPTREAPDPQIEPFGNTRCTMSWSLQIRERIWSSSSGSQPPDIRSSATAPGPPSPRYMRACAPPVPSENSTQPMAEVLPANNRRLIRRVALTECAERNSSLKGNESVAVSGFRQPGVRNDGAAHRPLATRSVRFSIAVGRPPAVSVTYRPHTK